MQSPLQTVAVVTLHPDNSSLEIPGRSCAVKSRLPHPGVMAKNDFCCAFMRRFIPTQSGLSQATVDLWENLLEGNAHSCSSADDMEKKIRKPAFTLGTRNRTQAFILQVSTNKKCPCLVRKCQKSGAPYTSKAYKSQQGN